MCLKYPEIDCWRSLTYCLICLISKAAFRVLLAGVVIVSPLPNSVQSLDMHSSSSHTLNATPTHMVSQLHMAYIPRHDASFITILYSSA